MSNQNLFESVQTIAQIIDNNCDNYEYYSECNNRKELLKFDEKYLPVSEVIDALKAIHRRKTLLQKDVLTMLFIAELGGEDEDLHNRRIK